MLLRQGQQYIALSWCRHSDQTWTFLAFFSFPPDATFLVCIIPSMLPLPQWVLILQMAPQCHFTDIVKVLEHFGSILERVPHALHPLLLQHICMVAEVGENMRN